MKTNTFLPSYPFSINNDNEFNAKALEIFQYQAQYNEVYSRYINSIDVKVEKVLHYSQIPFLPIQFFKTNDIICGNKPVEITFKSSGTGGDRSKHKVVDVKLYEESFTQAFKQFFGAPNDYIIIALLPSYLDQGDSSLVYMIDKLIQLSSHKESGFYLDKTDKLLSKIELLEQQKKVLLIGVTYALLDLAESQKINLKNTIVLETGGMKGRRKEMVREELHDVLKNAFGLPHIYSEYGMTELLSQAYLMENNRFKTPKWMKILIRDINDPLSIKTEGRGGINVIDLANINSCSFIATQDLGKLYNDNTFEVLGRFDNSDIRGCNLLIV